MTWAIIKLPHPLDGVWSRVCEDLDAANELENGSEEATTAAIMTIMALPARDLADSLYKLDCVGIDGPTPRSDCDLQAIMNEACGLIDAAMERGRRLSPQICKEAKLCASI